VIAIYHRVNAAAARLTEVLRTQVFPIGRPADAQAGASTTTTAAPTTTTLPTTTTAPETTTSTTATTAVPPTTPTTAAP
jgi:hypothetical protein